MWLCWMLCVRGGGCLGDTQGGLPDLVRGEGSCRTHEAVMGRTVSAQQGAEEQPSSIIGVLGSAEKST